MDPSMLDKYKYPVQLFSAQDFVTVVEEEHGSCLDNEKVEKIAELFMLMLMRYKFDRRKSDFEELEKIANDEKVIAFFRKLMASTEGGLAVLRGWNAALLAKRQEAPVTGYESSVKDHLNKEPDTDSWNKVWPWFEAHLKLLSATLTDEDGNCTLKEEGAVLELLLFVTASIGFYIRRDNRRLKPHSHLMVFPTKCFPVRMIQQHLAPLIEKAKEYETSDSINKKITHAKYKGFSALHLAGGFLGLPEITASIRDIPDICVNARTDHKEDALGIAIGSLHYLWQDNASTLNIIHSLIATPGIQLSKNCVAELGIVLKKYVDALYKESDTSELAYSLVNKVFECFSIIANASKESNAVAKAALLEILKLPAAYSPLLSGISSYSEVVNQLFDFLTNSINDKNIPVEERNFEGFKKSKPRMQHFYGYMVRYEETADDEILPKYWAVKDESSEMVTMGMLAVRHGHRIIAERGLSLKESARQGDTIFHLLVEDIADYSSLEDQDIACRIIKNLLSMLKESSQQDDADVSTKNGDGLTATDMCMKLYMEDRMPKILFLQAVSHLAKHHSAGQDQLLRLLTYVVANVSADEVEASATQGHEKGYKAVGEDSKTFYPKVLREVCESDHFDANGSDEEGFTIAHLAAMTGNGVALDALVAIEGHDPNIKDKNGNISLFYVMDSFDVAKTGILLNKVNWDLSTTNVLGESLIEYCDSMDDKVKGTRLRGLLEKQVGKDMASKEASFGAEDAPVSKPPREVSLRMVSIKKKQFVKTMDQDTIDQVYQKGQNVYDMRGLRKGRACIITNPRYDVPWLKPEDGYLCDRKQLANLLSQLGFDIFYPTCHDGTTLTAEEMKIAVTKFAHELTGDDHCSIVCVLTHGSDGCMYGKDGSKITAAQLLQPLTAEECPTMSGKPKIALLHGCSAKEEPAQPELVLPDSRDMFLAMTKQMTSEQMYESPDEGSVVVDSIVEIFGEHAKEDDINGLLEKVNRDSKMGDLFVYTMSSLTKSLAFFPIEE